LNFIAIDIISIIIFIIAFHFFLHAMGHLVESLRYNSEGRGFDSRMFPLEFFIEIILPAALMTLGLTQPVAEMSTRNISWEVKAADV